MSDILYDKVTGEPYIALQADCLLYRRQNPLGQVIAGVEGNPYSHAGFVYIQAGNLFVIDAKQPKVEQRLLIEDVLDGSRIKVRRRRFGLFTVEQQLRMQVLALGMVGVTGYSPRHLIENLWWQTFATPPTDDPRPYAIPDEVMCSELLSRLYRAGGLDPVPGAADRATSPADLDETGLLYTVCEELVL